MKNNLLKEVKIFAKCAHANQFRSGTKVPYFKHCEGVFKNVKKFADKDVNFLLAAQVAYLHDVLEDTGVSYQEIKTKFGKNVADGVLALTKNKNLNKKMRMQDSLNRIKLQPKEIALIKMCDRINNLSKTNPIWDYTKSYEYLLESKKILQSLKGENHKCEKALEKMITKYENKIKDKLNDIDKETK